MLKKEIVILGVIIICAVSNSLVFADNVQVNITNNASTKDCPHTPCFLPSQVTVSSGDTITWINLDNKTHTATAGTPNNGVVGLFDSGIIQPGQSYTQFFGKVGKYPYFDKTNSRIVGFVTVVNTKLSHPELAWVNYTLNILDEFGNQTKEPLAGQPITITKNITNTGDTDANSIFIRLKIMNTTNVLVYDKFINANIGAHQTVAIGFGKIIENAGKYNLIFDANPSNQIGDTNENNDISFDTMTIFNEKTSNEIPAEPTKTNPTSDNGTSSTVPEFGSLASIILVVAIASMIVFSTKIKFRRRW